jgi:hypothetical protein
MDSNQTGVCFRHHCICWQVKKQHYSVESDASVANTVNCIESGSIMCGCVSRKCLTRCHGNQTITTLTHKKRDILRTFIPFSWHLEVVFNLDVNKVCIFFVVAWENVTNEYCGVFWCFFTRNRSGMLYFEEIHVHVSPIGVLSSLASHCILCCEV